MLYQQELSFRIKLLFLDKLKEVTFLTELVSYWVSCLSSLQMVERNDQLKNSTLASNWERNANILSKNGSEAPRSTKQKHGQTCCWSSLHTSTYLHGL